MTVSRGARSTARNDEPRSRSPEQAMSVSDDAHQQPRRCARRNNPEIIPKVTPKPPGEKTTTPTPDDEQDGLP